SGSQGGASLPSCQPIAPPVPDAGPSGSPWRSIARQRLIRASRVASNNGRIMAVSLNEPSPAPGGAISVPRCRHGQLVDDTSIRVSSPPPRLSLREASCPREDPTPGQSTSVMINVLVRASNTTLPRGERNFLISGASSAARAYDSV